MTTNHPRVPQAEADRLCNTYLSAHERAQRTWDAAIIAERQHQEARLEALAVLYPAAEAARQAEQVDPTRLTEEQAVAAYTAAVEQLRKQWGYDDDPTFIAHPVQHQGAGANWPIGPVLVQDFEGWSTTSAWAIVWEGGPFEWAYNAVHGGRSEFGLQTQALELPEGVEMDAINSYSLSLYPGEPVELPAAVKVASR